MTCTSKPQFVWQTFQLMDKKLNLFLTTNETFTCAKVCEHFYFIAFAAFGSYFF